MDFNKLSLNEGAARFWSVVFGGITALGLVAGGFYTVLQYSDARDKDRNGREKDRENMGLQIATATLAAKEAFSAKHLELCAKATEDAGAIATSGEPTKVRAATDDFWRLYWGPLGIVEEEEVAKAMVAFGACLKDKPCDRPLTYLALDLAHACRAEVSKDFKLNLPEVPERPRASLGKP